MTGTGSALLQHHARPLNKARMMSSASVRLRIEALAPQISQLGGRALAELLIAIDQREPVPGSTLDLIEGYARLSSEMLRITGGDRFAQRLVVVPDDRSAAA